MKHETQIAQIDPELLGRVTSKPREKGSHNRYDDDDMLAIRQLHDAGVPVMKIADMLHTHRSSVYRALDRMGK